jgi:PAS domain S-box-containing protein
MNSSIAEAKCRQRADTGTPPAQILIVDDKVIDSDVMEALLRAAGYRTCCVASADQALIEIARHAPDLIVLDVGMPGKDGHELTRVLMASPEAGAIPVLIVSAMNDLAARLSGLQAGADVILSKPVDYRELKLQVRKLLTRKAADDRLRDQRRELGRQLSAQSADLQRCRAAMDATADAIFLVDRRTMRFIEVNTAAHRMLGYTRGELIDVGPAALADVTVERLAGLFDEIIAGNVSTAPVEAELRHRDGSVLQV